MPSDYADSPQDDEYAQCVLNARPVLYVPMGERAGDFADATGNGHTARVLRRDGLTYASQALVPTAPTTACPHTFSNALVLGNPDPGAPYADQFTYEGTRTQIVVDDHPALRGAGPFSLECWLYTNEPQVTTDQNAIVLHKVRAAYYDSPPFTGLRGYNGYTLGAVGPITVPIGEPPRAHLDFKLDGGAGSALGFNVLMGVANHLVVRLRPDGWLDGMLNGAEIVPGTVGGPQGSVSAAGDSSGMPLLIASDPSEYDPDWSFQFWSAPSFRGVVGHFAYYDYYLKDGMCAQHYAIGVATGAFPTGTAYTQPRRGQRVFAMGAAPYPPEPAGWQNVGFDDRAWGTAVVMTQDNSYSSYNPALRPNAPRQLQPPLPPTPTMLFYPPPPGTTIRPAFWLTDDNLALRSATDRLLLRLPITIGSTLPGIGSLLSFADDQDVDVYLNGTLLFSDAGITGASPYVLTAAQCALFMPNSVNMFALRVTNGSYNASLGGDPTYDYALGAALAFESTAQGSAARAHVWMALL